MASVLSLCPRNPLERPFTEPLYSRSCTTFADDSGNLRLVAGRSPSPASLLSISSLPPSALFFRSESSPPRISTSPLPGVLHNRFQQTSPSLSPDSTPLQDESSSSPSSVRTFSEHSDDTANVPPPSPLRVVNPTIRTPPPSRANSEEYQLEERPLGDIREESSGDLDTGNTADFADFSVDEDVDERDEPIDGTPNFTHWINKALRRKNVQIRNTVRPRQERWTLDDDDYETPKPSSQLRRTTYRHRMTPSAASSIAFVTAVKSTSVSISKYARSHVSRPSGETDRRGHGKGQRQSFDSVAASLSPLFDDAVWARSVKRRKIVEELISSEESYIRDLKTLTDVYWSHLSGRVEEGVSAQKSIVHILELHEDLLGQLNNAVASGKSVKLDGSQGPRTSRHIRWRSTDSAPRRSRILGLGQTRHSIDTSRPSLSQPSSVTADTKVALNVARIFEKFMRRFLEYEAFAANSNLIGAKAAALKASREWPEYERGVEALSSWAVSMENRGADVSKGLTLADLLIKPIQRICKYPLFFNDLCKQTPACDDPVANLELQKVLSRLRDTAVEINNAMDNPRTRKQIETSWILQDRLDFSDHNMPAMAILQTLGHVVLCGVLHVAYTAQHVQGQYMICVLYRSHFVLAAQWKNSSAYRVIGIVPLVNASIENSNNARGLQCFTALFTWKLILEHKLRQYELILSACSEREEIAWKTALRNRILVESKEFLSLRTSSGENLSMIPRDLRSIGQTFNPSSPTPSRRLSIHRAATLGPKTNLQQVIIKNTHAPKYSNEGNNISGQVTRSQSHLSGAHIPTLAPRRSERVKLELVLADVWTKDMLPFPGIRGKRSDNPIRTSANSVMRKLSMASIASNFSKRSNSFTTSNLHRVSNDENYARSGKSAAFASAPLAPAPGPAKITKAGEKQKRAAPPSLAPVASPPPAAPLVDFHNAPKAFLPEDFELKIKPARRSRRLSNRASMGDGSDREHLTPMQHQALRESGTRSACDFTESRYRHDIVDLGGDAGETGPSCSSWVDGVAETEVKGTRKRGREEGKKSEGEGRGLRFKGHHRSFRPHVKVRSKLFRLLG